VKRIEGERGYHVVWTFRISAMSNALAGRERQTEQAMARLRAVQPTLRLSNLHTDISASAGAYGQDHRGDAESRIARVVLDMSALGQASF
jgi:hypothetical protein